MKPPTRHTGCRCGTLTDVLPGRPIEQDQVVAFEFEKMRAIRTAEGRSMQH